MSTLKVNTIRHTGASSDAVTLASDGTCTAKITNNLSNRNLIINGAMNVAQRGTSTTTNLDFPVDRFRGSFSGTDESPTFAQHALTSSDTGPWAKGFRNSVHVTNGNQTGGAGTSDKVEFYTKLEAQDIANSGWDYTSTSSYITLSFWVKSSVAQNFYGYIINLDGTIKNFPFETGALSADTWTKITKTLPGHADLSFNNDNGEGLRIVILPFLGTDQTGSVSTGSWSTYNSATRTPNNTSTWYTTNDATFELTGVQLEVGDTATEFEHRSYSDELARCMRYFELITFNSTTNINARKPLFGNGSNSTLWFPTYKVVKRTEPALVSENFDADTVDMYNYSTGGTVIWSSVTGMEGDEYQGQIQIATTGGVSAGNFVSWRWKSSETAWIAMNSEL